jgi:hypothetical protein
MTKKQAERAGRAIQGNGQQGTGGLDNGQATGTPGQDGRQPHLGSRLDADSAPGGSGLSERTSDTGITDDHADEHTRQSPRERERDIGAQTPGDPGDLLSQPLGDGNYEKEGDEQIPLNGDPDRSE